MSRCKACDAILEEHEIVYKEEEGQMEELCSVCLAIIYKSEEEDVIEEAFEDLFYTGDD